MPKHNRKLLPAIITLIGMPAAGKTKVGRRLAEILSIDFVDTDEQVVATMGCENETLYTIVGRLSPKEFAIAEEAIAIHTLLGLQRPTVIATSGSMVYSDRAMSMLRERSFIVYLRATLETIQRRVAKRPDRGLVLSPGETIADLYKRRVPLYEKWACHTVDSDGNRNHLAEKLAQELLAKKIV